MGHAGRDRGGASARARRHCVLAAVEARTACGSSKPADSVRNDALVARLRDGTLRDDDSHIGVMHAKNAREMRGGFSLYVPETWDNQSPMAGSSASVSSSG